MTPRCSRRRARSRASGVTRTRLGGCGSRPGLSPAAHHRSRRRGRRTFNRPTGPFSPSFPPSTCAFTTAAGPLAASATGTADPTLALRLRPNPHRLFVDETFWMCSTSSPTRRGEVNSFAGLTTATTTVVNERVGVNSTRGPPLTPFPPATDRSVRPQNKDGRSERRVLCYRPRDFPRPEKEPRVNRLSRNS